MDLRTIDALVAEHLMGWVDVAYRIAGYGDGRNNTGEGPWYAWLGRPNTKSWTLLRPIPFYSSDITAAWEMVEKLEAPSMKDPDVWIGFQVRRLPEGKHEAGHVEGIPFGGSFFMKKYSAEADTAPLAICLAALKEKGIDLPS